MVTCADHLKLSGFLAECICLSVYLAVSFNLGGCNRTQRIDHGHTDTVQAAGHFVRGVVKFTTRVQSGHNQLQRSHIFGGMLFHRDTTTVILNRYRTIFKNGYLDPVTVAGEGLIYGVIHNLIYQVMQPLFSRVADIHSRAFAHRLQSVKDLNLFRPVGRVVLFAHVSTFFLKNK